jgi:hypothetical protein
MRSRSWLASTLRIFGLLALGVCLSAASASAQSVTYNFEDLTDQGFGHKFADDASESFPIVNIGGSNRMEVLRNGDFQEAERTTSNPADPQYQIMLAASAAESLATLSYDWYVDTSLAPGQYGNFLQVGTYVNTGSGYYAQDFPGTGKDVELNGTQLASGQVFSGTVSETFSTKGFDLPLAQTFFRLGLIINGDGAQAKVYFDNVTLSVVPEPTCLGLLGLGLGFVAMVTRRRS